LRKGGNKNEIVGKEVSSSSDNQTTTEDHPIEYRRFHYGLIAQEVKDVLDVNDIDTNDFAGYIENNGKYGLRYSEFISPMIKAIQELSDKVDSLTVRVEALENAS
jgi:hypothetical protein